MNAFVNPCFKAHILPGTDDYAYKGHVFNIEKVITTFFNQYPPSLEDMPHCIIKKMDGKNPNNRKYRDFKVSIIMICVFHYYDSL